MGERQSSTTSLKSTALDSPHPAAGSSFLPSQEQPQSARAAKPSPAFSIRIHDPTRVGDPIRGHVVYTVTTRTTSPHFHSSNNNTMGSAGEGMVEASVLRRFSQFLWLVDRLGTNNPGVIVPPVPDKQISGTSVSPPVFRVSGCKADFSAPTLLVPMLMGNLDSNRPIRGPVC